jgi:two-component system, NarL family, response regulator DesR
MAVRILIVDDITQVREDLRTLLTITGEYVIVGEAADGLQAISIVEALQPEVVLMDIEMPVMNGIEATHRIKARYPGCKVIALTIHTGEAENRKAIQAGVDIFIEKGAPINDLLGNIRKSLLE